MTGAARTSGTDEALARAWAVLGAVPDPEIPVISLVELGIVRSVEFGPAGELNVALTPTYTGCPATSVIRGDVERALVQAGYDRARVREVLSPPWTTDWITAEGRAKLAAYGIAPPEPRGSNAPAACPRCGSTDTELLSEFGSTPCKALHRCRACLEPFDRFKCL